MFRARCGRSTCSAAAICAAYLLPVLLASANGAVYGQALGSGGQLAEEAAGLSESEPHSDPRVRLREETASPQVRRLTVTAQQRCCVKARFCSQSQSVLFAVHVVTALSTASSGLRIQALACTAPTFCCAHTQSAASRGSLASRGRGAHKPPVILASKEEVRPAVCGLRFSNGLASSRRVSATWKRVCANRVRSAGAVRPERQGRDAPHRADAARRGRPLPKQLGVGRSGALGPRTCPRAGTGTAGSAVRPAACPTCTCGAGSGPAEAAAVQHIPLRRRYLKTLPGVHTAPSRLCPASAPMSLLSAEQRPAPPHAPGIVRHFQLPGQFPAAHAPEHVIMHVFIKALQTDDGITFRGARAPAPCVSLSSSCCPVCCSCESGAGAWRRNSGELSRCRTSPAADPRICSVLRAA